MMVEPTVQELLTKVTNRYELVVATAKRARQLADGEESLSNKKEASVVTLAAVEIAEGKVHTVKNSEEEA